MSPQRCAVASYCLWEKLFPYLSPLSSIPFQPKPFERNDLHLALRMIRGVLPKTKLKTFSHARGLGGAISAKGRYALKKTCKLL